MALREERNEENKHVWRKRFERERLDLSASVEAALVVDSTLEQQWLDEFDEQNDSPLATDGTASVSPHLSQQSSLLPIARPESSIAATTDAHLVVASSAAESTNRQVQRGGLLTRLTQRFTASFAAIDASTQQEKQPPRAVSAASGGLTAG